MPLLDACTCMMYIIFPKVHLIIVYNKLILLAKDVNWMNKIYLLTLKFN